MDNSMQGAHPVNHHTHVYDPQLTHPHHSLQHNGVDDQQQQQLHQQQHQQQSDSAAPLNADGTPVKRRPGRPKGSTKKNLLSDLLPPKVKRPVGRPRKDGLPAGSVSAGRAKRESGVQVAGLPVLTYPSAPLTGYSSLPYGYPLGAPVPPLPPPGVFQIDPVLRQENDWADLARTNPNTFLLTLITTLAAPNPVSTAGPSVEEAFKSHLGSLSQNAGQTQTIPSLYSILKTFWLPSSPAYFSLTASASTARTPSEHRFLYWDPQPLVFNGIACPSCSTPLNNKGRISSGPIKVYDIEKPFFIVGCEYVCRSSPCIAATSPEGRKFASTDPAILRSLPVRLKDELPAKLLHGDNDVGSGPGVWNWRALGVSTGLWNLVIGSLRAGLSKEIILGLLGSVQHGVPDLTGEATAQQHQYQQQALAQAVQHAQAQNQLEDKMDEDQEEEDEDEEGEDGEGDHQIANGTNETQTLTSTNFSDAYGAAWKENTATSSESPEKHAAAPLPAAQASTSAQPNSIPPQPIPQPGYTHYAPYPFTPYSAYLPHQIVNGQVVPVTVPTASASTGQGVISGVVGPDGTNPIAGPSTTAPKASGAPGKRSPRHCCKCGSHECKGKGGRSFCTNPCQDCGSLECKGRNSRRPDKKCSEGWQ